MSKTDGVKMPAELASKYRFTGNIQGGPTFDFPQFGFFKLNLSELSASMAERLIAKGWVGIARVENTRTLPTASGKPDKE